MNLDAAQIDLSKCFVEGMGYVALSRLRTIEGLKINGINEMAFMVNQVITEFDKILKEMSERVSAELKSIDKLTKEKLQRQFLDSVMQKKSVKEISEARNLNQETIIDHLKKIKNKVN
jgi:DNA-binding CsgD family transcriptional regulator